MPPFRFGKNWRHFNSSYLNTERMEYAKRSLQNFLGLQSLEGKTFLDIGAGSGIYSLAALELGAKEILSVDYDQDCIDCCDALKAQKGNPAHWTIKKASILDDAFVSSTKPHDVVYSWGVLHHTGKMWTAIDNAMKLTALHGLLFIAIYNKADGFAFYPDGRFGPTSFWKIEKRIYSSLPWFLQNCIDYCVMAVLVLLYLVTLRNPARVIRNHKDYSGKGMAWRIDIKDWLGGYPYEAATVEEIFAFGKERHFSLENLHCNNGLLNNEFLLKKQA